MALTLSSILLMSFLVLLQQTLCLHPDLKSWYSSLWCTVHKTVTWWAVMIRLFLQFWLGCGKSEFLKFYKLLSTISPAAIRAFFDLKSWCSSVQFTVHRSSIPQLSYVCVTGRPCVAFCNTKARSGSKRCQTSSSSSSSQPINIKIYDDDGQNANLNGSRVGCTWFWQLAEGQAASQNSTWSHNFVFIQKLMEEKSMQIWILIFIYIFLAEGHSASQNSSCIFKTLFFNLLKTVVDMSGMPEWLIRRYKMSLISTISNNENEYGWFNRC